MSKVQDRRTASRVNPGHAITADGPTRRWRLRQACSDRTRCGGGGFSEHLFAQAMPNRLDPATLSEGRCGAMWGKGQIQHGASPAMDARNAATDTQSAAVQFWRSAFWPVGTAAIGAAEPGRTFRCPLVAAHSCDKSAGRTLPRTARPAGSSSLAHTVKSQRLGPAPAAEPVRSSGR